jgi:uncharacterized cupredoxin-like copper-binding protein
MNPIVAIYGIVFSLILGFIVGFGLTGMAMRWNPPMLTPAGPIAIQAPVAAQAEAKPAAAAAAKPATAAAAKPAGAGTEVKFVGTDLKFTPNKATGKVGQVYTIVLDNKGLIEHDIAFPGLKGTSSAPDAKVLVKPGETGKMDVTFSEAGTYEFVCTIPGHKEAGMKGTMTIEK